MLFQSRNREAFHFRSYLFGDGRVLVVGVSISQSRGFSFQDPHAGLSLIDLGDVSISQSRGFSFQVSHPGPLPHPP